MRPCPFFGRSRGKSGCSADNPKSTRMTHRRHRETKSPLANVGFWAEAKCYRPDELDRSCGSRPIIKLTFLFGTKTRVPRGVLRGGGRQNSGEFQMPRLN